MVFSVKKLRYKIEKNDCISSEMSKRRDAEFPVLVFDPYGKVKKVLTRKIIREESWQRGLDPSVEKCCPC